MTLAMIPAKISSDTLAETSHAQRPPAPMPLMQRLRLGVLSLVTAATVLTATAMPAMADRRSDDVAKALAAIAAIALIANQLENRDDRYVRPYRPPVAHPYRPPVVTHPRPTHPRPDHSGRARVPSVCAIEIEDDYDVARVYSERCLRREGFDYRLPRGCAREVRLQGRNDRIYTERCLRQAGFRVGRRDY